MVAIAAVSTVLPIATARSQTPGTHTADATSSNLLEGYRLGSGDRVRITVFGQNDLTGEYTIDGSGMLSFPLIGQVRAGGRSADAVSLILAADLSPAYLKAPRINVEVLTYRPFYIIGEVNKPGSYPYVSGMTVMNAVALAGGFTYRAKQSAFYVSRDEGDSGKQQLQGAPDTPVQPGDVITIRERIF